MAPDGNEKERFLALYGSYARAYERFLEHGFKTLATCLLILGWLLSSPGTRGFLGNHEVFRYLALGLVLIAAVFLCLTFTRLSRLSRDLRLRLDGLAFIESDFYSQHRIPPLIYWSVVGQNLLLFLFIALMLTTL